MAMTYEPIPRPRVVGRRERRLPPSFILERPPAKQPVEQPKEPKRRKRRRTF